MQDVLIVGHPSDEHAVAVERAIGARACVTYLDASTVAEGGWRWSEGLQIGDPSQSRRPSRGWLRRLAPPGWLHGVEVGTLSSVESNACLQLLAAACDTLSSTLWLTDYWTTMRAENKLVQYAAASRVGVPVPTCIVTADPADLQPLGKAMVMKPLGLGAFTERGISYSIHARLVAQSDPSLDDLAVAPFIAQRHVDAVRHLRIPTVGRRAWPCQLDADGLPLDWRADDAAHSSWRKCHGEEPASRLALLVASELGLGYSCQDWIEDPDGSVWLVDVNPGGQWLFLPSEVADEVTHALAAWLVGETDE